MNDPQPLKQSAAARWIPRIVTGLAFLFCLGFFLHTGPDPVLFGKYNTRYLIGLAVIFFVMLPLLFFTVRFFLVTHELKGSGGRRILVGPKRKLTVGLFLGLIGYIALNAYVGRLLSGSIATRGTDVFHPYLQNVPRSSDPAQHTNRWGFKGDELELAKPKDTFRLFMFGGSTVHCGTVPFEQTHCRLLEDRLHAAYPNLKIEVQNLGGEWHCTEHSVIELLFYAQDFSPDLVVIFHGINDLARSFETYYFSEGPYRSDYGHYHGAISNIVQPNKMAHMFFHAAGGHWCSDLRFQQVRLAGPEGKGQGGMLTMFFPKARPVEIEHWNALPAFDRNLREFVEIAQRKGMQVLLATQPSLYREDLTPYEQQVLSFPISHQFQGQQASLKSMTEGMRQFNDATLRIARDKQVRLVDLEPMMPKTAEYMYDDVHYTKAGNELIGNAFADDIIAWGIIPKTLAERAAAEPTNETETESPTAP